MQFTLRPATLEDAAAIASVQVNTWQVAYPNIIDADYLEDFALEKATLAQIDRIGSDGHLRTVAEIQSKVVGYAVSNIKKEGYFVGNWFLYALYVLPEHQGKGIGKALLEDAKTKGRNQGHARIVFDVFTGNEPAKSFYESNGATFLFQTEFELGGKTYPTDCYEIEFCPDP